MTHRPDPRAVPTSEDQVQFESLVGSEAAGAATPAQLAILRADPVRWRAALVDLLADTDAALMSVRTLTGPERAQIVADFEGERASLSAALRRLGAEHPPTRSTRAQDREPVELGLACLQMSWVPGRVVAWTGDRGVRSANASRVRELLAEANAPSSGWVTHASVTLPSGERADALSIPVSDVLGWLHAVGTDNTPRLAASARWLGQIAVWAVMLVAQGAVVPLLRPRDRDEARAIARFSVRWTPALIDSRRLGELADDMPGAVAVLDLNADAYRIIRSALTGIVDAMCRDAARRVEVPAPSPHPRSAEDIAETFLCRLDGTQFDAPVSAGRELASSLDRWAGAVTKPVVARLVVQLDPPDSTGAWNVGVLVPNAAGVLVPVAAALRGARPKSDYGDIEDHLDRVVRLLPLLNRGRSDSVGEVVCDDGEAFELMSETGSTLRAAGFDVRVPAFSPRRPTASLRLYADGSASSIVGAQQLAAVRWSVLFDDVELTAADIASLAAQARPLVRTGGGWVALEHADLAAAAAALAERADTTALSGAEMLRHALGLEPSVLPGGVTVDGNGWAADVVTRASQVSGPAPTPAGFVGSLRSYQGEALAWLGFLDGSDLGGCLALDMGLGKTPTMLAHLVATSSSPCLVIAPPAVVGNWAAEAARFTPGLRVVIHHGATRSTATEIATEAADADVVVTTYGTAVRDIDALETVSWDRLILDEAQAIKNPASDTAQQLRRIPARARIALTGTPIENGLGDLWAILDFTNPSLIGSRASFITAMTPADGATGAPGEDALRALNGILVFRRTKAEPVIAAELPDRIDELDHCTMTTEQIGLYQAVLDRLVTGTTADPSTPRQGQILAAITALKQICNHPSAYHHDDDAPLSGRSGKLARLDEIIDAVFDAGERALVFTHFATWGQRLAEHLTARTGHPVSCYHGGLARGARDRLIAQFQAETGPGALVLSLKAGGTGLNLTNANHVVLYDRWWNPAVEDQARDRAWRIGQTHTVICHRLVCPGTVDERVEEVVEGKRRIADLALPKSSSLADLDPTQLRSALGLRPEELLTDEAEQTASKQPGRAR